MLLLGVVRVAISILVLASCVPCKGRQAVAQAYESGGVLRTELAKCAGQRVCLAPCMDLLPLPEDNELQSCKVTFDDTGNGVLEADYVDMSVCAASDSGGDVVIDDSSSWDDSGDDGSTDDGSSDDGSDDGSSDDGSSDDGSSDDGSDLRLHPTSRPALVSRART